MPETSSPGNDTGETTTTATATTTPGSKCVPGPYEPPLDALVRMLPTTVRYSGKVWWNEWIGNAFHNKKRDLNGGAKGWIHRQFIRDWWLDNMPEIDISDKDKLWYFDHTKVGTQIYSYLNNSSVRSTNGCDPNGPGTTKDDPILKQHQQGDYYWRRANPNQFDEAVETWMKAHKGKELNFGQLGKIGYDAFKGLPQAQQDEYEAMAKVALKASQDGVWLPSSIERVRFYDKSFNKDLDGLLKRGDNRAGVRFIGALVHEKPDGTLKIDRADAGEPVESSIPTSMVYPNYAKENYLTIPDYVGWTLEPLQGLVRGCIKGILAFQGGNCRVMWTEIKANPMKYIHPKRIPQILLENLDDPSRFSMYITTLWVDFLFTCQKNDIPDDEQFQFTLVPAGSNPIHPSKSQEDSRTQVEHDGKLVWMLVFMRTVTKCHQPKGPKAMLDFYPKGTIAYANHMAAGTVHTHAVCVPPQSWLSLPGANPSIPDFVIGSPEKEYWFNLSTLLPSSQKVLVTILVD
ncbi:hypothetical protein FRC11_005193 [Ceratobasidium sp. 423]|nr:hypothetical protein FRC11_005193 [Ceratobasidium sp. 423]